MVVPVVMVAVVVVGSVVVLGTAVVAVGRVHDRMLMMSTQMEPISLVSVGTSTDLHRSGSTRRPTAACAAWIFSAGNRSELRSIASQGHEFCTTRAGRTPEPTANHRALV